MSTLFNTTTQPSTVRGLVEVCELDGTVLFQKYNQLQYDWAAIAGRCVALGDTSFKLSGMYLEYQNVAQPTDPAALPDTSRSTSQAYYANLAATPNRDFLRLPFVALPATSRDGAFVAHFASQTGFGNVYTCSVVTAGTAGFHGKPFAVSGTNSKIAGLALVAMPIPESQSADLLFARLALSAPEQVLFSAGAHKLVRWHVAFQ